MKKIFTLVVFAALTIGTAYGEAVTVNGLSYELQGTYIGSASSSLSATLLGFADDVVMSDITVPSSFKFGGKTFYVTKIRSNAFTGQTALVNATIDASKMECIDDFAFYECSNLRTLTFIGGNSKLRICKRAFGKTDIQEVELPNMLRLDTLAFMQCTRLEKVTFNNISYMNKRVFDGCTKLYSIVWNSSAAELKLARENSDKYIRITADPSTNPLWFYQAKIRQVQAGTASYKGGVSIPGYLFKGFTNLNVVVIGPGVAKIGNGAFMECLALNSMSMRSANSLQSIGDSAFYSCPIAGNLLIQSGNLEYIGEKAFLNCQCPNIELGYASGSAAVTIGTLAFSNNTTTKITIRANVAKLNYGAFACPAAKEIYYAPANGYAVQSTNDNAFAYCSGVTDLTINHGGEVNKYMFPECTAIQRLYIENAATVIGNSFHHCKNIQEVVWNVTAQEDYDSYTDPFSYSNHITSCTVKSERVPAYLLYGQRDLKEWTASSNTTYIGSFALSYSGLEELTLEAETGKNMVIDNFAFYHCDRLRRIHSQYYFPPQLGNGVFRDVNENLANITLIVPNADSKVIYQNTNVWKEFFAICEDIDQVESEKISGEGKFLRDGQLFIRKGDKVYNIQGQIIKN